MDTISKLLYDAVFDTDKHIKPNQEQYNKANSVISDILEQFKNKLEPDEYAQIEAMLEASEDMKNMEGYSSFSLGLIIGAMLIIEIFTGKRGLM